MVWYRQTRVAKKIVVDLRVESRKACSIANFVLMSERMAITKRVEW